jgi:hypothetical protein
LPPKIRVCCFCRSLSTALHTNAAACQRLHTNCPCYAAGPPKKRKSKGRYKPKRLDPEVFAKIWGTPAERLHGLSSAEKLARSCVHHQDLHRWVGFLPLALTAAAVSSLCLLAAICLLSERERVFFAPIITNRPLCRWLLQRAGGQQPNLFAERRELRVWYLEHGRHWLQRAGIMGESFR